MQIAARRRDQISWCSVQGRQRRGSRSDLMGEIVTGQQQSGSWRYVGGALVVATALLAAFGLGYTVGADKNDSFVANLEDDKRDLQAEVKELRDGAERLTAENNRLRIELARESETAIPAGVAMASGVGNAAGIATATGRGSMTIGGHAVGEIVSNNNEPKRAIARVGLGKTSTLFSGQLSITLVVTDYTGDPLRNTAYLTVASPRKPQITYESVDAGFKVAYENFEITLMEVETFTIVVRVDQLEPTTQ